MHILQFAEILGVVFLLRQVFDDLRRFDFVRLFVGFGRRMSGCGKLLEPTEDRPTLLIGWLNGGLDGWLDGGLVGSNGGKKVLLRRTKETGRVGLRMRPRGQING